MRYTNNPTGTKDRALQSQEQLADAVGVSRQSINSIERDRYVPSLSLALMLARVFGCSIEQIFTLESDK